METQSLTLPIDAIETDFDEFITANTNKRIIFSGPFGIGKTYFLDKYFGKSDSKYLPIFLRPVNYSLLSNEDIFRLIKYDILLQLINNKEFNIENEFNFSELDYARFFVGENRFLILQNLLKLLPKIQSTVDGVVNLSKLIDAYKIGKQKVNQDEDLKMLYDFQTETQENFLLEYDQISQFIANKLDEISGKDNDEKRLIKVLIIDDLDRLDPEHIFRLFNVFSAHFDHVNYYTNGSEDKGKDNKFGFNKIIFVCDIDNIRKLFAHKYGLGVDFSGYIDKFYSRRIYYLTHKNVFKKYINPYLITEFRKLPLESKPITQIVNFLLEILFLGNQLNIRDINRITDFHLNAFWVKGKYTYDEIQLSKLFAPSNSKLERYPICIAIYMFSHHFGSSTILKDKLKNAFIFMNCIEDEQEAYYYAEILQSLILFADYKNHKFKVIEASNANFEYMGCPYQISGGFINRDYEEGMMWFRTNITKNNFKISKGLLYKALVEASVNIIDAGILSLS